VLGFGRYGGMKERGGGYRRTDALPETAGLAGGDEVGESVVGAGRAGDSKEGENGGLHGDGGGT
jgi:hypothetical protein